ncbi:MAG: hypothetical protein Kow0047_04290 [Anaerolineae bacterium]
MTPGVCSICRHSPPPLTAIRSATEFQDPIREAIHRLKYRGCRDLAMPLAQLMYDRWPPDWGDVDLLAPVPLHPDRERARGYNQAALLARELANRLAVPLATHLLERVRATRPQVELSAQERRENVRGAFIVPRPEEARGAVVVLIDDVATTAATLSACADALWAAGVADVRAFTLARAAWSPNVDTSHKASSSAVDRRSHLMDRL